MGTTVANASGDASLTVAVPAGASGITERFQALEGSSCRVSDAVDHTFPDFVEEKLERGRQLQRNNWGTRAVEEIENSLAQELVSEAADLVDAYNYGEVWDRTDLTAKERMVCILVALQCRGHMKQLKTHVGYALNMGLAKREICEVFSQAGWYRGWPYVEDALEQAKF